MSDTIFMVHGMWAGPWCWENYRHVLESAGYRCVATTLPYHDVAPHDTPDPRLGTTSLLDYAAALEREIARLGEKPILMGHSMGGLLVQILGARGLGRALVLLTPAAPAGLPAVSPSVVRSFWRMQATWGWWRKPLRPTPADARYALLHLLPEAQRRQTYERFVYESGKATFEIGYWFFDRRGASGVDATSITCPVLVVGAAQDRMTPAAVVRRVARKYAAVSTYREFEHHAHWIVEEPGWEKVAHYTLTWIEATKHAV